MQASFASRFFWVLTRRMTIGSHMRRTRGGQTMTATIHGTQITTAGGTQSTSGSGMHPGTTIRTTSTHPGTTLRTTSSVRSTRTTTKRARDSTWGDGVGHVARSCHLKWCASPFLQGSGFFLAEITRYCVFVLPNRGRMCIGQCTFPITRLVHSLVYVTLFARARFFHCWSYPPLGVCFPQSWAHVLWSVHMSYYTSCSFFGVRNLFFGRVRFFSLLKLPAIGCLFYQIVGACALVSVHLLLHVLFILWCLRGANSSGGKKKGGHKLKVDQSQYLGNSFFILRGAVGARKGGKQKLKVDQSQYLIDLEG